MIGQPPNFSLEDPTMEGMDQVVIMTWGDEILEFESPEEISAFVEKLKALSKKGYKPLVNV